MKTLQQIINEEATYQSFGGVEKCVIRGGNYKNFKDLLEQIKDYPILTTLDIYSCKIEDGSDFNLLNEKLNPDKHRNFILIKDCEIKNLTIANAARIEAIISNTKISGDFIIKGKVKTLYFIECGFEKCTGWIGDHANIELLDYAMSGRSCAYLKGIEGEFSVDKLNCSRIAMRIFGNGLDLYQSRSYQELKQNTQKYFHAKKISVSHWNNI